MPAVRGRDELRVFGVFYVHILLRPSPRPRRTTPRLFHAHAADLVGR